MSRPVETPDECFDRLCAWIGERTGLSRQEIEGVFQADQEFWLRQAGRPIWVIERIEDDGDGG